MQRLLFHLVRGALNIVRVALQKQTEAEIILTLVNSLRSDSFFGS